jgi:hypothetical protein
MINYRAEINRGCTNTNQLNSVSFIAATSLKIESVGISTADTSGGYYTPVINITVSNGVTSVNSGNIVVDGANRHDEFFTLPNGGLVCEIGQTVTISVTRDYAVYYSLWNGESITGNHLAILFTGSNCYDMVLNYQYEPAFTYDAQNDGYPYPSGTDPTVFTELEKDSAGYPKNWSAWKYDSNNEGYPWIVGFSQTPAGIGLYKKTANGLVPVLVYRKTANGLVPVLIYKKTTNGLVSIG